VKCRSVVVVATTGDEEATVEARLVALGLAVTRVMAPGEQRRLVLATADDDDRAEKAAALLRAEGMAAVTRPDGGPRLDAWMRHTRPIAFGDRLSVCFAWAEYERDGLPGLIELGPGGFGNGDHPTTRLLIEELIRRIVGGERVLDVGCGSGVLGLCALRLGASQVIATDVKAEAVEASRRNALLNDMQSRLDAKLAPLDERDGPFDVVVANVGRAAITELAAPLIRLVAPGGWLAVSGISPSQSSLVAALLSPLVEVERRSTGEWAAVVLAPT
jgi:ribosomal protein L11 methyltransferase